jgi:hypothetical protein
VFVVDVGETEADGLEDLGQFLDCEEAALESELQAGELRLAQGGFQEPQADVASDRVEAAAAERYGPSAATDVTTTPSERV